MFRTSRDTAKWFNNDDKGHLKDKRYISAMAPGVYNPTEKPLGDKKKNVSWNYGAVPFGTCKERFKSDHRTLPGPGQYEKDVLQLTKPIPLKPTSQSPKTSPVLSRFKSRQSLEKQESGTSLVTITPALNAHSVAVSTMGQTKQAKNLIENQQSWAFKSKEPKTAIYRDEEKRINQLYGSRQGLKYKIKLNDRILDNELKESQSPQKG